MSPQEEAELIARCRSGDPGAWEELLETHYPPLGRFVFQLAPDFTREDVEEICQEALVSVVRNLGSFRGASRFQTWLFRIAANKARDFAQRRSAAKRGGTHRTVSLQAEDPETGLTIDPPSEVPGPDASLVHREWMAQLRAAVDQLAPPCREIIELRYFGDLSYEDLAESLQLNPKTVSSRLSRCLERLEAIARELLKIHGSGEDRVGHQSH
jgi:RNA polymerase sigma-70 factor (ECF subfamily)